MKKKRVDIKWRNIEESGYLGRDQYADRSAKVFRNPIGFYVELYTDNKLEERRNLYNQDRSYAEDCAENWVMGVIN